MTRLDPKKMKIDLMKKSQRESRSENMASNPRRTTSLKTTAEQTARTKANISGLVGVPS